MKRMKLIISLIILATTCQYCSCSARTHHEAVTRGAAETDPPYFAGIVWPPTCSELPEGRLVITGTLVFPPPAQPHPEIPIRLFALSDPGSCGETGGGSKGEGQPELDTNKLPHVQEMVNKVLRFLDSRRKGEKNGVELPEGCQGYGLFPDENNEYTYFTAENGRFRLDFDEWCRFNPGDKILIIVGEDDEGQTVTETNIYRIPHYAPDAYAATLQVRHGYGEMMTELGQGMLDALSFYPVERTVDIQAISATKVLYEQAYLGVTVMTNYREIGEAYGQQMELIAQEIAEPVFKDQFLAVADFAEEEFVFKGDLMQGAHFQRLFAESDPIQNFWDSVEKLETRYNRFPITVQREFPPSGGIEVTFDIRKGEQAIASFTMVGSSTVPLAVTGNIGNESIEEDDYNPYFIEIFAMLFDAGFVPVIAH